MKKYFLSLLLVFVGMQSASAKDGFYLGADISRNTAEQKYHDRGFYSDSVPLPQSFVRDNSVGYGINAGYKNEINKSVFIAPEIFYDRLLLASKDFFYNDPNYPAPNDHIRFNSRSGLKVNLGYNFNEKFAAYVNAGMAQINYKFNYESINFTEEKSKITPVFGIGALYNLTDSVALRAEYNRQNFNLRYGYGTPNVPGLNGTVARSRVQIEVLKLGIVYSF